MNTIKTRIHQYRFDTRNADERAAWRALSATLTASHPRCMESHGGNAMHYMPQWGAVREIELETAHIFDNQWNTAPIPGISDEGYRVFDWALDYKPNGNAHIKQGHYIEQTGEMREVRRNTAACGYCGKQEPAAKGYVFCPHCIGSDTLKESDLPLTRMRPAGESFGAKREPLTEAERAHLLPQYVEAQTHGRTEADKKRIAAARERVEKEYQKAIRAATQEHAGLLWLMDRGIRTDNVLYYKHTERFCFGWRNKLEGELLSAILSVVLEFPYAYDIECADGRKLRGD